MFIAITGRPYITVLEGIVGMGIADTSVLFPGVKPLKGGMISHCLETICPGLGILCARIIQHELGHVYNASDIDEPIICNMAGNNALRISSWCNHTLEQIYQYIVLN